MIRTGDTIHNPITGERITFLATSADTDGEAVVIETVAPLGRLLGYGATYTPGDGVPAALGI